jgi:hypothetical protein
VAATWSIRVDKTFTYRGVLTKFSNRYHIGVNGPPDSTHWTTFSDAIVTAEKAIFEAPANGGAQIVGTVGYAAGSEVPVFTKTYATNGTGSFIGTGSIAPGDCAALVRYSTADRSTKNHPVYCFNYYHTVFMAPGVSRDVVLAAQVTALSTYATAWITGFSDGTTTFHRSRPTGDLCTGSVVKTFITHRDLPH